MTTPEPSSTPAATISAPAHPLPSLASLTKATGVALVVAVVLLVFVVLPAEYNIDPTGIGGAIGLTRLSAPAAASTSKSGKKREDKVVVKVPAGKGVEYKFKMRTGERMKYEWTAGESSLFFDFHGEPKGAAKDVFESFAVSTATKARGTFTAPFEGVHGWYWKNRSSAPVNVTLTTSGTYEILGLR